MPEPRRAAISSSVVLNEFRGSGVIPVFDGAVVVGARVLCDDRYVAVVEVTYLFNGEEQTKTLVLRIPAAAIVVIRDGEGGKEVLVISELRHGTGSINVELPGGMKKPGETWADAALRELAEETSYDLTLDGEEPVVFHRDPARSVDLLAYVYFLEVGNQPALPANHGFGEVGEEIVDRTWIPVSFLKRQLAAGEIADAILAAAVGVLLARGY